MPFKHFTMQMQMNSMLRIILHNANLYKFIIEFRHPICQKLDQNLSQHVKVPKCMPMLFVFFPHSWFDSKWLSLWFFECLLMFVCWYASAAYECHWWNSVSAWVLPCLSISTFLDWMSIWRWARCSRRHLGKVEWMDSKGLWSVSGLPGPSPALGPLNPSSFHIRVLRGKSWSSRKLKRRIADHRPTVASHA